MGFGNRRWAARASALFVVASFFAPMDALRAAEAPQAKAAASGGDDVWFAETVQHGDLGIRVMNIWSKGRKLRAERTVDGAVLLTIVNGDTYYNILPTAGVGVAIQRAPKAVAQDKKGVRPFGHDAASILARGAEKATTERLMGREVAVYRLSSENTREEVWATNDEEKLPVKVVFTDKTEGKTFETMLNWTRGLVLTDSFFEPDPRIVMEKVSYEDFVASVQDGKLKTFPPLFNYLLVGE